jgi:hypothetical protein
MIDVFSWAQVENNIYFKSYQTCPGTFVYNIDNGELLVIDDMYKWNSYGCFRTTAVGEYVVFAPYFGNDEILVYNTKSKIFKAEKKRNINSKYRSSAVWKNKLYMFPNGSCSIDEIAVFDSNAGNIIYPFKNDNMNLEINAYGNAVVDNGNVYLPLNDYNQVLKINLITCDYKTLSVGERKERFGVILKVGEMFYLSGEKNYIYIWDGEQSVREIPLQDRSRGELIPWEQLFSDAILYENNIIFSPLRYSHIISLGLDDLKVDYIYKLDDTSDISWGMEKLRKDIFMSTTDISGNKCRQYLISNINNEMIVNEREVIKLDEYIDLCRYGIEYSEFALKKFIRNIVEA